MVNDRCVRKFVLSCFFLFQTSAVLLSQGLTDLHWRFGNTSQALDFNKGDFEPIVVDDQAVPFGLGGGVTISDPLTGDLWFYTDGASVYDGSNRLTPNGTGLGGDPSLNQAAVACPVPGVDGQFYIFTNPGATGANEIQVSIADKNLPGNASATAPTLGDISQLNNGTGLISPSEAMVIIPGPNSQRFWLLSQNRTTGDYVVFEVSTANFGNTTTFNFSDASNPTFEAAAFGVHRFRPDSIMIAVAPKTGNRNIQILLFDASTGTLAFERQMLNTGVNDGSGQAIYDVEWSFDGTKLYYTRHGGNNALTGQLMQFDFDSLQTSNLITSGLFRSFGLKRGPDRRIYHMYQAANSGPFSIGRINQPDSLPDSVAYQAQIPDFQDALGRQFPATSPSGDVTFNMSFNIFGFCQNTPTLFSPSVEPTPQFVTWDFGDGAQSFEYAPIYTYQDPGPYTVTMTAFLNGQSQSTTQVLNIIDNQLQLNLNDTTICPGEILERNALPSGQQGNYSFLWSTGETTQVIEIDSAGTFWVQVTDLATGCPAFTSFEVTVYGNEESVANIWYFGEQAGIDFNETPPVALTDENLMDSPEGCASISDRNGDLLFYTNGRTVWNKDHEVMLNGVLIGGDSTSAQSSIILPVPDNETLFYIITTDQVYGDRTYNMRFSVVDMKLDLARGGVIIKDRPLFTNSSEKLAATGVGGGTTWLFGHEYGNNNYRAYPITTAGIGNAIVTSVGRTLSFAEELNGRGTMKVSPTAVQVGSVIPGAQNFIEIVNFRDSTGTFLSPLLIDLEEPAPSEAYGIEFSSSGARLYVTLTGGNSQLLQYNLDSLLNATNTWANDSIELFIQQSKFELATGQGFGSLQTGPDQIIYMAKDNSTNLGSITNSNGDEADANYNDEGFDLEGRISRLGLPNFAQNVLNPPQDPSIAVDGGCVGQPTRFTATGTSDIDEFEWNFGDGSAPVFGPDTTHVYQQAGLFNVTLNITNRCGLDTTLVQPVTINLTPEQPQVPSAVAICDDNGVVISALPQDIAGISYTWSTGETTREITVLEPSTITIFLTNAAGCRSDTLTTLVGDQRPVVDLGPDQVICAGEELDPLDAQNPGATYSWAINGAGTGNATRFQEVDTSAPGDFEYAVSIVDVNGCQTTSTINYTILEPPTAVVTPTATTGCGIADGYLLLDVSNSGSFSYQVSGPSTTIFRSADGPFTDSIPSLAAGSYRVTISNIITGCSATFGAVGIDSGSPSFTIDSAAPVPGCEDGSITFTTSIAGNYSYRIIDFSSGSVTASNTISATNTATENGLPFGTYTLEVTNTDDGCLQTQQDIVVEQAPTAEFTFDPIQTDCGTEGTIAVRPVTAGATYTWTALDGTILSDTTETATVTVSGIYTVVSSGPGLCSQTEQIEFFLSQEPEGEIVVVGDPCDGELTLTANLLSAGDPANFIFGWSNGASTASTVVNQSGAYTVTIRDRNSGCFVNIDTTVQVETVLEVTLIQQPDCDNETQVILTAQANIPAQVTFEWTAPDGTILSETTASISTGLGGLYQVTVRGIDSSCQASAELEVSVLPIFDSEILLPQVLTFCSEDPANGTVALSPGIFNTYEWRRLPSQDIISLQSTYMASEPGTYEVTFSNGSICRTARVVVTDDCRPKVFAPNAFSPNGNGQNEDFFVFPNPYVTDFSIFIYNRWGELVYQSDNVDFRWNGSFNGTPLPVSTYAYVMRYRSNLDATNELFEQRGGITLVK